MKHLMDIKTVITILCFSCTFGLSPFSSAENKLPSSSSNNQLTLENGNLVLNGRTYKVDSNAAIYGGHALDGNAMNNNIVVVSGTYSVANSIVGGYATGEKKQASNNVITVIGGQIHASIYGGELQAIDGSSACNNVVNIEGGEVHHIYGGRGGEQVFNNAVNIKGGKVGGVTDGTYGKVNSFVYGGHGICKNNSINIYNHPDLSEAYLVAGLNTAEGRVATAGNAINLYTKGIETMGISWFQNLNFYLPEDISDGEAVINVIWDRTELENVSIKVVIPANALLETGDAVYLLNNPNGISVNEATTFVAESVDGKSMHCYLSEDRCHLVGVVQ